MVKFTSARLQNYIVLITKQKGEGAGFFLARCIVDVLTEFCCILLKYKNLPSEVEDLAKKAGFCHKLSILFDIIGLKRIHVWAKKWNENKPRDVLLETVLFFLMNFEIKLKSLN